MDRYESEDRADTFIPHAFQERTIELGEVRLNYVRVGNPNKPALLLIPGPTESWWGYEAALPMLAEHFEVFAVDLRGQGRSSWTPGRYTIDNMGSDLVRFIDLVIRRPTIVSGLSSGGVISAWLSAYAKPGQIIAAHYEDPPLFGSERKDPEFMATDGSPFALWNKYLGDQWQIGDWSGMKAAAPRELFPWLARFILIPDEPSQNMKEYDPEWGRATCEGTLMGGCDHARMLSRVKVPVLFTHHFNGVDPATGREMGAISAANAQRARELLIGTGNRFDYQLHPSMGHSMHAQDPALFSRTLIEWSAALRAR